MQCRSNSGITEAGALFIAPVLLRAGHLGQWHSLCFGGLGGELFSNPNMRPLKLHLKTTLLVSTITLAVLTALVFLISARLAAVLYDEERKLADLEATRLAEQYSNRAPDAEALQNAAALVRGTRFERVNIRIWKRVGAEFIAEWTTSSRTREMPAEAAAQLQQRQVARLESDYVIEHSNANYRVFAPIFRDGQVYGAVEISDHLDTLPTVLRRFWGVTILLALLAVGLIALTTHLLFRNLIDRPIGQLLRVIAQAKAGALHAQAPTRRPDELGRLAQEFNSLLGQLHLMTTEREQQQDELRDRVRAATAQLQERNHELETTNQELWRTSQRLTQLERLAAAGQTAAQFAHEVGTPLNVISCHTQLMQAELGTNPAAVQERTEIVLEQAERIERIVRRMLDRTRIETSEFAPLDLNLLLKRTVDATAPTLLARGVTLALALELSLPKITGDADKLQQCFLNLINNALDAMSAGGRLTIATARAAVTNGHAPPVTVSFADTGCGMTPDVVAHIFDPLYTTKKRSQGTGLGLVIVHQVVQEHGGEIVVESAPERGSRFLLTFPALAAVAGAAKGQ
jgi:signal transduction histidine kinase